jgi:hypothetical protein
VARGTRDTKIQVIEVSVSSLYISPLWLYRPYLLMLKGFVDGNVDIFQEQL